MSCVSQYLAAYELISSTQSVWKLTGTLVPTKEKEEIEHMVYSKSMVIYEELTEGSSRL